MSHNPPASACIGGDHFRCRKRSLAVLIGRIREMLKNLGKLPVFVSENTLMLAIGWGYGTRQRESRDPAQCAAGFSVSPGVRTQRMHLDAVLEHGDADVAVGVHADREGEIGGVVDREGDEVVGPHGPGGEAGAVILFGRLACCKGLGGTGQ